MSFLFNRQFGPGVEEYLKPQELYTLGLVSKVSRSRPEQVAFRQKARQIMEYPFISFMPMRYSSRKLGISMVELYEILEFLWNTQEPIENSPLNSLDMLFFRAEMNTSESNKLALDTIHDIETIFQLKEKGYTDKDLLNAGYEPSLVNLSKNETDTTLLLNLSARLSNFFGVTIYREMLTKLFELVSYTDNIVYYAFPLDKGIRTITIELYQKYNNGSNNICGYTTATVKANNIDGYPLSNDIMFEILTNTSITYQDTDLYIAYLKQYMRSVPENEIRQIFEKGDMLSQEKAIALRNKCGGFKP